MKKFLFFSKMAARAKKSFEKSQFLYIIMLYLYVHFPSDVLAAAVLGVMIGELAFYADRRWTERRGT